MRYTRNFRGEVDGLPPWVLGAGCALCACLLLVPSSLWAQADQGTQAPWRASFGYEASAFSGDRSAWHTLTATLGRRFEAGALDIGGRAISRFDIWDHSVLSDGWSELWEGAWGRVHLEIAPEAQVAPETDVLADLYQGFGEGWELGAGYQNWRYPADTIHRARLSLGKSLGKWFVRGRVTIVRAPTETGHLETLDFYRRFDDPDDQLMLSVGGGQDVLISTTVLRLKKGGGTEQIVRVARLRTFFVGAVWERFLTRHWGLGLGGRFQETDAIPTEFGFSVGALARW